MDNLEEITLRKHQKILGILGIMLPTLSVGFGLIGFYFGKNEPGWYESISATYYANSKMMMIGLLFAMSLYYWAYKGYDTLDDVVTKLCAAMAMLIVAFPCADGRATTEEIVGLFCLPLKVSGIVHTVSATILYVLFFVQTLRFTKHGDVVTEQKKKRNKVYYTCMVLMVIGMTFILLTNVIGALKPLHYFVLIGECFLQLAFGTAWLVKAGCITRLNDK